MNKVTILQFLFNEPWSELGPVINLFEAQGFIAKSTSITDPIVLNENESRGPILVLAKVESSRDLSLVVQFIKNNRKIFKSHSFKFVAVNWMQNKDVETALNKLGVTEFLDKSIKEKALKLKFDFWLKALLKSKQDGESKASEEMLSWLPSIDCMDDFWILKTRDDCKFSRQKWVVKMIGPNPHIGEWLPFDKENQWCFKIKNNKSVIGQWIFEGENKPEYLWREEKWLFSSNIMSLFYVGSRFYDRFYCKNNKASMAENSPQALAQEAFLYSGSKKQLLVEEENLIEPQKLIAPKISVSVTFQDSNVHFSAKIDDVFENELTLLVKSGSYEEHHSYEIRILLDSNGIKNEYKISSDLEEVFSEGDDTYLKFILSPNDLKKLSFYFESLNQRQNDISEFLLKAKGY